MPGERENSLRANGLLTEVCTSTTQRVYWVDRCDKASKGQARNVDEIPYVEVFEELRLDSLGQAFRPQAGRSLLLLCVSLMIRKA
jgi:hypothetical protein